MVISILRLSFITFITACLTFFSADAQYFYKDILSISKLNKEFAQMKQVNIKAVEINSFDENDKPSKGFFCEKKINKNFTQSEMMSQSNITGQSLLITDYNSKGQVIKTVTTTPDATNTAEFSYDDNGNLTMVSTRTIANDDSTGIKETHQYTYTNNKPVKMIRKKNGLLVSVITFLADDQGNIIEEDVSGNSSDIKYYYYYDDKNRLTDVVHYNLIARRLLPDYMFEYNSNNEPRQMISVDESGRNYLIWKYAYNDKFLPEIQKCFSKEKRLLGTVQFEYK